MPRRKIPHFRFYIDDFLTGTKDMAAATVGDYIRLLCAIYDHDGMLPNDPYALRHLLGCTRAVDVTQRIMRLVVSGKLNLSKDGYLSNGRADKEIDKRHEFQTRNPAVKGAVKGAAKGAAKGAVEPHVSYLKKPIKSVGVSTLAQEPRTLKEKKEKEKKEAGGNGSEATASSPGFEGRSSAVPSLPQMQEAPPAAIQPLTAEQEAERIERLKSDWPGASDHLFAKLRKH